MKESWRRYSLCQQLTDRCKQWFFGDDPLLPTQEQHERASMFCLICPVQIECLADAMGGDDGFGVWGGLTPSQRKRYAAPAVRRRGRSDAVLRQVTVEITRKNQKRLALHLADRNVPPGSEVHVLIEALSAVYEPDRAVVG